MDKYEIWITCWNHIHYFAWRMQDRHTLCKKYGFGMINLNPHGMMELCVRFMSKKESDPSRFRSGN